MAKFGIGVIGCGAISRAYLTHGKAYPILDFVACADLDEQKAKEAAANHGVPRACSVDELLESDDVDIVLNLTVPKAHVPVGLRALRAGKHVYSEKPLGISREEAQSMLDLAREQGLRVGNAPDTFFGAGHQTARRLIDEGAIGQPVAATAFMMGRGHESWHPSPEFYYEPGGGPMFDMGPYYLTAMINMLGPIDGVSGTAAIAIPRRTITSQPKHGKVIEVTTPDHITGTMRFGGGAVGTIITSFATAHSTHNHAQPITVYGTEGTLQVPDPNGFDGKVLVRSLSDTEWREAKVEHRAGYGRAVGLADMAHAIAEDRPHRASGELAMAVLDAMQGFLESSDTGQSHRLGAKPDRPAPLPTHLPQGQLD